MALAGTWSSGEALAAGNRAKARGQLRKAGELAAKGQCKRAIPLYTKAYGSLKDPVILFNRAECYRDENRMKEAVADYKKFLAEMPGAPNRALVQGRISELETPAATEPIAVATPPAPPAPQDPPPPAPIATAVPAPADEAKDPGPGDSPGDSIQPLQEGDTALAPSFADDSGDKGAGNDLGLTENPSHDEADEGTSTWVWVGVGVAALAAAGVIAFLMLSGDEETTIPDTGLGNYKF